MTGNRDPRVIAGINRALELGRAGQQDRAVAHLLKLLKDFPNAASIHGYLGICLLRLNRSDEAVFHGRKAALLSPQSEKASLVLFSALWRAGQHIEALDEMKRFLLIKPSKVYSDMIKQWDLDELEKETDG